MFSEESICFAKMTAAEESTMSRKRGGVWSFEDRVFACIDQWFFLLCMTSPEQEYQEITFIWKCLNNCIGKYLPSFVTMRHRLSSTDGERRIEEEDTLLCPTWEITIFWSCCTHIALNFLKNIPQRWRISDSFLDWKSETVCLSWSMIGILS